MRVSYASTIAIVRAIAFSRDKKRETWSVQTCVVHFLILWFNFMNLQAVSSFPLNGDNSLGISYRMSSNCSILQDTI